MRYRLFQVLTALLVILPLLSVSSAQAAGKEASLKVDVGYQNYYNPNTWVPIRVTVSAAKSRPLKGVLYFSVSSANLPFAGKFTWNLTHSRMVSPGLQTSSLTFGLPGLFLKNGGELMWQEGGRVIARSRLPGIAISGSEIAGVISEHPETVQFLAGVSSNNNTGELVTAYIPPQAIPTAVPLLSSINYLYVDGSAAALLSPLQITSIFNWVKAGGILILGGIQPNAGQISRFLGYSPVIPRIVLDQPPNLLTNYAGGAAISTNESLLFGALAPGAKALVGNGQYTLVAESSLGRGMVVYTGFDAASPDFISWSGNAQFWDTLLHTLRTQTVADKSNLFGSSGLWTLYSAAEQFPQLHAPPLWIWESVFGVYVFTVGPLLYFILRKRRKNELAWAFLPLISVLLAGAIYMVGVLQQPNGILTQSVGLVDLFDPGLAQIIGVEAMMSPQTRSYAIRMPQGTLSASMTDQAPSSVSKKVLSEISDQFGKITFNHVNAWTGKFIFSSRMTSGLGYVKGVLYAEGSTLAGYLTNATPLDLTSAALVYHNRVIALGNLNKGQSININVVLKNVSSRTSPVSVLGAVFPSASHGVGKSLYANVGNILGHPIPANEAMLVAWSHDQPVLFMPEGPVLPATPEWLTREMIPVTQIRG